MRPTTLISISPSTGAFLRLSSKRSCRTSDQKENREKKTGKRVERRTAAVNFERAGTRYIIFGEVITRTREGEGLVWAALEKIKVRAEESPRLIKKSIHIFAFQDRSSSAATESDEDKTRPEERRERN